MVIRIANPVLVRKVEKLARLTGISKIAAVERAVDRLLSEEASKAPVVERVADLLDQMDRIPDRADAFDPLR